MEGESRYQPNRLYSASGGVVSAFCEPPQLGTCGMLDCCFGAAADCFIWVHESAQECSSNVLACSNDWVADLCATHFHWAE